MGEVKEKRVTGASEFSDSPIQEYLLSMSLVWRYHNA